ncbi:hypothetical protein EVAR_94992_1 [Eumeta japonica]|uniref:Uncharacterized protein n=1 Tax=Eumeta variegata TaxID=151549 RepID=A0A4C1UVV3_EUMVA|nr:hypothetical protein EVAR_94992_1 [Eumeta japonica]
MAERGSPITVDHNKSGATCASGGGRGVDGVVLLTSHGGYDVPGLGFCLTIVIELEPVLTAPRLSDPPLARRLDPPSSSPSLWLNAIRDG